MSAQLRPFDFKNPDYTTVLAERLERLRRLRALSKDNPQALAHVFAHYRERPGAFISDWGVTHDPRNPERGLPASVPFILFPKQREFIDFVLQRWRNQESGLIEKSRDMGCSWLAMALSCTLCIFQRGITIGVGSRKEQLLDNAGDPNSLFFKARMFLDSLPVEFRGQYTTAHMRIIFPATGSAVTGEAGDNIGRGGRTSIFFLDEAAHVERPSLVDASLSATTNCRIDVSSVNGTNNPFAQKRFSGRVPVFTMHWRDDPRKDSKWYEKQCRELDPVTVAQEIDINYQGSADGVLIPSAWVQAAIGAAQRLGIKPSGLRTAALDVADEGKDLCALAARYGVVLNYLKSWSGKGSDSYRSVVKAFGLCDELGLTSLYYDADGGFGSGVRAAARLINADREAAGKGHILDEPFRGSASVCRPNGQMVPGRSNGDLFANLKAQSYWGLRLRFQNTYRAVVDGLKVELDEIISIDPKLPELLQLTMELSQPTYSINSAGKILVDKQPAGTKSPNLADAVHMAFNPLTQAAATWLKLGLAD